MPIYDYYVHCLYIYKQSEEELQQTLADVNRAADLGDPELTGDVIVIARFLVKNNLLGGIVGSMGARPWDLTPRAMRLQLINIKI